jgi:hypothetical protein
MTSAQRRDASRCISPPERARARARPTTGEAAMTDLSIAAKASPGAERMRRHRWLRQQGAVNINVLIGADAVQRLTELGWLAPADRANRVAVRSAIVRLAAHALGLGPTR